MDLFYQNDFVAHAPHALKIQGRISASMFKIKNFFVQFLSRLQRKVLM